MWELSYIDSLVDVEDVGTLITDLRDGLSTVHRELLGTRAPPLLPEFHRDVCPRFWSLVMV